MIKQKGLLAKSFFAYLSGFYPLIFRKPSV